VLVKAVAPGALDQAVAMTRSGGTLVLVALPGVPAPLDVDARAVRELSLHGTYAYQDRDFADAADVIDRQVDGDRVVTKLVQLRRQKLPDPRPFECAVQQAEHSHQELPSVVNSA
jgi:threonine dehydrogenase-like Zn-dependent dehydrogenase